MKRSIFCCSSYCNYYIFYYPNFHSTQIILRHVQILPSKYLNDLNGYAFLVHVIDASIRFKRYRFTLLISKTKYCSFTHLSFDQTRFVQSNDSHDSSHAFTFFLARYLLWYCQLIQRGYQRSEKY